MHEIEELYRQYYDVIFKYLMCLSKNKEIAEDLTQETFYKMIKKINTYKGKAKFSVWLCEIAKNTYYDELRKNKKISKNEEIDNIISDQNLEIDCIEKEQKLKTYEKINQLDEISRRVLYLRINSELSFKEIGEILGKTENWARVTFYRGKQKIKEGKEHGK